MELLEPIDDFGMRPWWFWTRIVGILLGALAFVVLTVTASLTVLCG